MIEEIWRPVVGYEGLYEVSNTGQVRSLDRYVKNNHSYRLHKGKVLSLLKNEYGYIQVVLSCNGKHNTITVHRLVAQAFILNPNNLPEVNHKDEDKTNNSVENLEWCTAKYNSNYGTRNIRRRETLIKKESWNGFRCGLSRKEYKKKYYEENRDRICEQQKKYRRKRKEEIQNNA